MNQSPSLLTDRLISVRLAGSVEERLSLPQIMAALALAEIESFPIARRHQRYPLKAFLAQLAAVACQKANETALPTEEERWTRMLRDLSPGYPGDEPWLLYNERLDAPAFMQPPVPGIKIGDRNLKKAPTPDDIDIPIQSRRFESRLRADVAPSPDAWIFALITIQTHGGFLGNGNHGVARMNGGFGSRPHIGLAPSPGIAAQIKRDAELLISHEEMRSDAETLAWTIPWSGHRDEMIDPRRMHPLFIEVCRIIRLRVRPNGRLGALRKTTAAPRTKRDQSGSRITDPWAPRSRKTGTFLTIGPNGFTENLMDSLLQRPDIWELPVLAIPSTRETKSKKDMILSAGALARGRGRTHGYHETNMRLLYDDLIKLTAAGPADPAAVRRRNEEPGADVALSPLRRAAIAYMSGGLNRESPPAKRAAVEIVTAIHDSLKRSETDPTARARRALEILMKNHAPQSADRPRARAQARALLAAELGREKTLPNRRTV